ncbi:ribonuclease P protein component [Nocardiopsis sp. MG754419]|uniref:ribonuclease P protein component n=1 Tax=Nocardiopsis sp. MG754419 TaxID=2259865 RepID=UPI001BA86D27|nr:ribonuclease P protein component [Nocardiopsis sp. MG754419]MBR8741380.1 ribonuclease P protein component [Nocardiopsis sp. MG754419]
MLSPRNRMRHSSEFGSVMRSGRRASRDALGVVYLAPKPAATTDTAEPPRVGFVVSKAVGGAVVRKRVQRRLRHVMRARLGVLPNGSLLVVRAKPLAAQLRQGDLAVQLDSAIAAAQRPRGASRRRTGRGGQGTSTGRPAESGTDGNRRPDEGAERWTSR